MVSYARQHSSHPKLAYELLDITEDVSEFLHQYGPFDRLYCFNSLNRVKDQPKAWINMAKLLKPGGECLLFYGAWYVTPEIWRALARKERWRKFAEVWEGLIPASRDMGSNEDRLNHVRSLAKDVGLELRSCEMAHIYLPLQEWSGMLTALIP
nr:juvenile hormone acid O-methyltransferase-like [Dermacentor andersoni]